MVDSPAGPGREHDSRHVRGWRVALAVALCYLLSAVVGDLLAATGTVYVCFWLPSGAYVAALLLTSRATWPWVVAGAFTGNAIFDLMRGSPLSVILSFHLANASQALVGAVLVQRVVGLDVRLASVRALFVIVGLAGLASTVVGATIGASTLLLYDYSDDFLQSFLVWWGSCAMAVLVILPLALAWRPAAHGPWLPRPRPARLLEFALLCSSMLAVTYWLLVLQGGIMGPHKYALFPALIWAGVRFGPRGATSVSLLLALALTFLTSEYRVGITPDDYAHGAYVLVLQSFTAIATFVGLVPALALAERNESVAELEASQERYRTLGEAAFEGIAISEDGRVLDANDQLLNMFGYSRQEFLGRWIPDLVAEESRERVAAAIEQGRAEVFEHDLLRKDGTTFTAEAQARVVQQGGRSLRMLAIRDISSRKRAEAAIRSGETMLREFIAHAPAAIAMLDRELRYLHVSDRWLTDYRLAEADIIGRHHYDIFPEVPERWKAVHQRALAGAVERSDEDPFPRNDGTTEWLQWEVRPWLRPDETIGGIVFFTQVITQRKAEQSKQQALEEQLRQAQKMDAIGTLAGGIAHDFNNILCAIVAHTELAKMDNPENQALLENLNQVGVAYSRAASLVQQILTFSRQQPKERRALQLESVVREALKLLRSTLPSTIQMEIRIQQVSPVLADATHMHQILINLCTNAHHAMLDRPGTLTVEIAEVVLDDEAALLHDVVPGKYVQLGVTDTGTGMSAETRQRVFEPFFTTKRQHEGTGLGLAVVHGIVKEHRGAISVESTVGVGTTFRVLLPTIEAEAEQIARTDVQPPRGRGQRILVVDDEASLAEATGKVLERWGYEATSVGRSSAAWALFSETPDAFDLMLTDLTMPEFDGLELASRVHSLRPNFPVLLATGSLTEATQRRAVEGAIRRVLLKPLDYRHLVAVIAEELVPAVQNHESQHHTPTGPRHHWRDFTP